MKDVLLYFVILSFMFHPNTLLSDNNSTVAILHFQGDKIPKNYREAITNAFESELSKLKKYNLVNRQDIDSVVNEYNQQMMGLTADEGKYYSEIGKGLGAQKLIVGKVELISNLYNVQVKLINVESITNEVVVSEEYYGNPEGLVKVAKILAYKLCNEKVPKEIYKSDFLSDKDLNIPKFSQPKIQTPWYKTWWFWSIMGFVTISTAASITYIVTHDQPSDSDSTNINIGGDMEDSDINIGKQQ